MSLRSLAASSRPLAEVFVDRLRHGAGLSRLAGHIPAVEDDDGQRLDEDYNDAERDRAKPRASCAPDAAASAILLGRAFENSRDIPARLTASDTVAIIQVPDPDLVKPIGRLLRVLVASDATLIDGEDLTDRNRFSPTTNSVVVFTDSGKSKVTAEDDEAVAASSDRSLGMAEKPANSGLLRTRERSPDSRFPVFGGQTTESLRPTPRIFPFYGD